MEETVRYGRIKDENYSFEFGKLPPQAKELEEVVIGAVLIEPQELHKALNILHSECFYVDAHQRIWKAISALYARNQPADILTVSEELRKMGELDNAGGSFYIATLTNRIGSAANVEYHAYIVKEKYVARKAIEIQSRCIRELYEDTEDAMQSLSTLQTALLELNGEINKSKEVMFSDAVAERVTEIKEAAKDKTYKTGHIVHLTALDKQTMGWQPSDLIIVAARPAMGKCLGKGTKVVMFDGRLKCVEDIQYGDRLMGVNSEPRLVLGTCKGTEEMFWIRQNKGIDYRVNKSHILSLKRSRTENCHKHGDVLNISVSDYIDKSKKFKSNYKGYKSGFELPEKELPMEPYFLGVWLGDGNCANVRITNPDAEVVSYLENYAEKIGANFSSYKDSKRCAQHSITYPKGFKGNLQGKLNELGLLKNKHIPDLFMYNSSENRLQLLAGLLDTDGYLTSNCFEIVQKNKTLAFQIKQLADSLGFRTTIKSKIAQIKTIGYKCEVWRLNIFGGTDSIPTKIKRKQATVSHKIRDTSHTGIRVEPDGYGEYYGFELDGDGLFLLEDGTVTHNTAFAVWCATQQAKNNLPVGFMSLEMSTSQLIDRILSAESQVGLSTIRRAGLKFDEWQRFDHKVGQIIGYPFFVDDRGGLKITEVCNTITNWVVKYGIKVVYIDYLQLIRASGSKKNTSREQDVTEVTQALKALAKNMDIAIVALSQLSREVEKRGDKRPILADLRESGSIEQEADMVIFPFCENYYNEQADATKCELIIAKYRNGQTGMVEVDFIKEFQKFQDRTPF